jgi:gliding motility-associated-like protein
MKKLLSLLFLSSCYFSYSQIQITSGITPANLVQNVLIGNGVSASNISFTGDPNQIGQFNGVNSTIGMSAGIVIASGDVNTIPTPNPSTAYSGAGDPDLLTIAQSVTTNPDAGFITSTNDAAILEFDFVPQGDTVSFNFVFASEEYLTYVNTSYNDVFGFFLSGPGITGPYAAPAAFPNGAINLASVPGSNPPLPITISTIYPPGDYDFDGNQDPGFNEQYYIDNPTDNTHGLNGFTTPLSIGFDVICGETYHFKFAVADCQDGVLDTDVFFEAGSFQSEVVNIAIATINGDSTVIEGCTNAQFVFTRPTSQAADTLIVNYTIAGNATQGSDFNNMINPVTFLPGEDTIVLTLNPTDDGIDDGPETVIITAYTVNDCGDTLVSTDTLYILDAPEAIFSASTVDGCEPLDVTFTNTSKHSDNYAWTFGNGQTANVNNLNAQTQTYIAPGTAQLIVSFDGQCPDTATIAINAYVCGCTDPLATNYNPLATVNDGSCIFPYPTVIAPNVFTPDGNEENPFFELTTTNATNIEFTITNRWGITVYTGSGINPVWDGKVNGNPASEGVYFYQYTVTGVTGDTLEGHGFVELIR